MASSNRRVRRVLLTVLAGNASVAALKLSAGWSYGALAVLADGVDSAVDALATVLLLIVARAAVQPPDADHPYGHGRYEAVGAFALSGLLFLMAWEVLRAAVTRLLEGAPPPTVGPVLVGVMVVSVLVNLLITTYEERRGTELGSPMLQADAAHTRGDVVVGVGVLASLGLVHLGVAWADAGVAVLVAGFIAYTGYNVVQDTFPVLTDHIVYDPRDVKHLAESVDGVEDAHDIRSRGRKGEAFIQLHILVEAQDVERAHAITREVEELLMDHLGAREVFVHVEPEDHGRPDLPTDHDPTTP